MFTGIVEKTVRVVGAVAGPKFRRLTLAVDWPDVQDGESVAVNGYRLTVSEMQGVKIASVIVSKLREET